MFILIRNIKGTEKKVEFFHVWGILYAAAAGWLTCDEDYFLDSYFTTFFRLRGACLHFFSIQLMLYALRYSCCIRWLRWNRESSFTSKKNPPKRRNSHILQWITTWLIFWATTGSSSMSRIGFDLVGKKSMLWRAEFVVYLLSCVWLTLSLVLNIHLVSL